MKSAKWNNWSFGLDLERVSVTTVVPTIESFGHNSIGLGKRDSFDAVAQLLKSHNISRFRSSYCPLTEFMPIFLKNLRRVIEYNRIFYGQPTSGMKLRLRPKKSRNNCLSIMGFWSFADELVDEVKVENNLEIQLVTSEVLNYVMSLAMREWLLQSYGSKWLPFRSLIKLLLLALVLLKPSETSAERTEHWLPPVVFIDRKLLKRLIVSICPGRTRSNSKEFRVLCVLSTETVELPGSEQRIIRYESLCGKRYNRQNKSLATKLGTPAYMSGGVPIWNVEGIQHMRIAA